VDVLFTPVDVKLPLNKAMAMTGMMILMLMHINRLAFVLLKDKKL
jgi:hypothetical protein